MAACSRFSQSKPPFFVDLQGLFASEPVGALIGEELHLLVWRHRSDMSIIGSDADWRRGDHRKWIGLCFPQSIVQLGPPEILLTRAGMVSQPAVAHTLFELLNNELRQSGTEPLAQRRPFCLD